MRFSVRDGFATLFIAAAAALFGLWISGAALTGLTTRWMAVIVFGLGFVTCMIDQRQMAIVYGADRSAKAASLGYVVVASLLGGLALVTGIIAIVTASTAMLVTLLAAMVALWLLTTGRHVMIARQPARHA